MQREVQKLLFDVLGAGKDIQAFVSGLAEAEYRQNRMVQAAVERKFEVIGERLSRLRHLDEGLLAAIPEHRRIIGFRNVIIHGYDTIDPALIWDAVQNHLPELIRIVTRLLDES